MEKGLNSFMQNQYDGEIKRLRGKLQQIGYDSKNENQLDDHNLSEGSKGMIQEMASLASLLELGDCDTKSYIGSFYKIMQDITKAEKDQEDIKRELSSIHDQLINAQSDKKNLVDLNKQLSSKHASTIEEQTLVQHRTIEYTTKQHIYKQQIDKLKQDILQNGFFQESINSNTVVSEVEHHHLMKLQKELESIEKENHVLHQKLHKYGDLPPNKHEAMMKLKKAKEELEKIETEFNSKIIQKML